MEEIRCNILGKTYSLPLDKVYDYMKFFSLPTKEEFEKDLERTLKEDKVTEISVKFLLDYIDLEQFKACEPTKADLKYVVEQSKKRGNV